MEKDNTKALSNVIRIDDERIQDHLGSKIVRGSVEALWGARVSPGTVEVRNVSLLVAIGVNADGYRELLGIVEGAKEDKAGWSGAQRCASHPEAPQGARPAGHRAGDLRCLSRPGGERHRGLSPGPLAALRRALVAQRLQPCAERQDARGFPDVEGHPCPGEPRDCPGQGRGGRRQAQGPAPGQDRAVARSDD